MATPVGHSLAGYAVYRSCAARESLRPMHALLLCIVMANLPDVDFLPGILAGKPALYHQGITHSLAAALLVPLAAAGLISLGDVSFPRVLALCLASYASHLAIDFLGADRLRPYGLPLFWPVSGERFLSPVPVLLGVRHTRVTSDSIGDWIRNILVMRNLLAIALEVGLIAPFVLLARWRGRTGAGTRA